MRDLSFSQPPIPSFNPNIELMIRKQQAGFVKISKVGERHRDLASRPCIVFTRLAANFQTLVDQFSCWWKAWFFAVNPYKKS